MMIWWMIYQYAYEFKIININFNIASFQFWEDLCHQSLHYGLFCYTNDNFIMSSFVKCDVKDWFQTIITYSINIFLGIEIKTIYVKVFCLFFSPKREHNTKVKQYEIIHKDSCTKTLFMWQLPPLKLAPSSFTRQLYLTKHRLHILVSSCSPMMMTSQKKRRQKKTHSDIRLSFFQAVSHPGSSRTSASLLLKVKRWMETLDDKRGRRTTKRTVVSNGDTYEWHREKGG